MHERYGPIIRISPHEIHVSTPDFFPEIYSQTERRDIWRWQRRGFGAPDSTLSTVHHDHHRQRRAALNPLFSRQRIVRLQPVMQERLNSLLARIKTFGEDGQILNVQHAFGAFAAGKSISVSHRSLFVSKKLNSFRIDVGMEYFFGQSQKKVNALDFDPGFHDAIQSGFNNVLPMNHFPWVMDGMIGIAKRTPDWLLRNYFARKKSTTFITAQLTMRTQVHEILAQPEPAKEEAVNHTMFDQILSSNLPPEEKTPARLVQEGTLVMVGATLSTAWSMSVATFCLIKHPTALKKVKDELTKAFPGGPDTIQDLVVLEHLPYLSAVLNESLRIGIGVSHRSARISPNKSLPYTNPATGKQWLIPAGTPMSMSHPLLMRDPTIFPDPTTFRPERWIEDPSLERYQFAFSRGTRGCIGITLALTEMRLIVANVFSRYGSVDYSIPGDLGRLELFETDFSDIDCMADGGIAMAKEGSKGVRVKALPK